MSGALKSVIGTVQAQPIKRSFTNPTFAALTLASGVAAVILSTSAPSVAFTVGQVSSNSSLTTLRGQSFTPNTIGPGGSGSAPASGKVPLQSITFAYQSPKDRTATTLYIYTGIKEISTAALTGGVGAAFTSSGFFDSGSNDPRFGAFPSRTFTFSGVDLDVNTLYQVLFPIDQTIRNNSTSVYSAGAEYRNFGGPVAAFPDQDAAFIADFTPAPVPFPFAPLPGVALAATSWAIRRTRQKLMIKA